ncbi:MAG: hypothetical protein ABI655_06545 [Phenylobacterium sp.]
MIESTGQRADRYRKIAFEARALARRSVEPKLVAAYVDLAETWERMAGEVDSQPGGRPSDLKGPRSR